MSQSLHVPVVLHTGPVLLAGKALAVTDPFVFFQMTKHGLWPNKAVEDRLANRQFQLVVLGTDPSTTGSDIWPEPLLQTIRHNYHVVERYECRGAAFMLQPNAETAKHPNKATNRSD
jgi:hypothetical protein